MLGRKRRKPGCQKQKCKRVALCCCAHKTMGEQEHNRNTSPGYQAIRHARAGDALCCEALTSGIRCAGMMRVRQKRVGRTRPKLPPKKQTFNETANMFATGDHHGLKEMLGDCFHNTQMRGERQKQKAVVWGYCCRG